MKRKVLVAALIMIALASLLVGCNSSTNYDGMTKITYELEGGSYKNCELPVYQYYEFKEGTSNLIYDPVDLSKEKVKREGYKFLGWFRTKSGSGDDTVYSDQWDFSTDKVGIEGVTLYAGWELKVNYTYNVCYIDENGEKVILGSYKVKEGAVFSDSRSKYANKRLGYTAYINYNGSLLNGGYYLDPELTQPVADYKHPGGESDCAIDVYVRYIEGEYAIVRTASDLSLARADNIYLDADIDMGGKTLSFDNYTKIFEGNGHTVSNFKIKYAANDQNLMENFEDGSKNALFVSLFGGMTGATVRNVTFTGATLTIQGVFSKVAYIYFAPLSMSVKDSKLEGVKLELTYEVKELPRKDTFIDIFESGCRTIENSTDGFEVVLKKAD
mgnify:CR=1 FL=1